jgi:hypothetical protein
MLVAILWTFRLMETQVCRVATPVVVNQIHTPAMVVHIKLKVNGLADHLHKLTSSAKLMNGNETHTLHKHTNLITIRNCNQSQKSS